MNESFKNFLNRHQGPSSPQSSFIESPGHTHNFGASGLELLRQKVPGYQSWYQPATMLKKWRFSGPESLVFESSSALEFDELAALKG